MRACVDAHILIQSMYKHRNVTMQCQCDVVIQLLVNSQCMYGIRSQHMQYLIYAYITCNVTHEMVLL